MSDLNVSGDVSRVLAQIRNMQGALQLPSAAPAGTTATSGPGFADALKGAVGQVNATQQTAGRLQDRFSRGDDTVQLSDVMLASARSQVEFRAMTEVRNRLVSAYQDIMNMPI